MGLIFGLFIVGLILVIKGGDWFVDSSVSIARLTGLPEIFIGATIVSLATTLPEVIVSATAAYKGHTTMSIGNAVGSMICNAGLILGFIVIMSPNRVSKNIFRVKGFLVLMYTLFLVLLSYDGMIYQQEALVLLLLLVVYMIINTVILKHTKDKNRPGSQAKAERKEKIKIGVFFTLGIGAIIVGSNLLINNGVQIASFIGIPEAVISLTLIALGTSLPELVTAVTALKKGNTSISTGNILGANILNITLVLGISGIIEPLEVLKQNRVLDIPIAALLLLILILPTLKSHRVTRGQGVMLFSGYVIYLGFLAALYI